MVQMLEPMLASLEDVRLDDPNLVYEPKYDGIRAIVEVGAGGDPVRLWSRLGNEKTTQFPEIVSTLKHWGRSRREAVVLDGEIVALSDTGEPTGFQNLQGRIHLKEIRGARHRKGGPSSSASARADELASFGATSPKRVRREGEPSSPSRPSVALIAFDVLRTGNADLRDRPLTERRAVLERLFAKTGSPILRISEQDVGDGHAMYARAKAGGWEGLIAKRTASRYLSGK